MSLPLTALALTKPRLRVGNGSAWRVPKKRVRFTLPSPFWYSRLKMGKHIVSDDVDHHKEAGTRARMSSRPQASLTLALCQAKVEPQ